MSEGEKKVEKKQPRKSAGKKQTLRELVAASDLSGPKICMELSRAGLLKQLEFEQKTNRPVKPSITQAEFDKIMNGGA